MDTSDRHKADSDWHGGVFVGVQTRSTEFIIATANGLFRASHHHVRRVVEERAFQSKSLQDMAYDIDYYLTKGASASSPGVTAQDPVQGGGSGGRGNDGQK